MSAFSLPSCRVAPTLCARSCEKIAGRFFIGIVALCAAFASAPCAAQDMPVPPMVQARYFKKVFNYDKSLPKEGIKVVVAYSDASAEIKDDMTQAFSSVGLNVVAVKASQLASAGAGANVVYACSGSEVRAVRDFCRTNSVLSITGFPRYVRDGDISIGMDNVNEQPKIVVNADRLKTEKQDAPDLLRFR